MLQRQPADVTFREARITDVQAIDSGVRGLVDLTTPRSADELDVAA